MLLLFEVKTGIIPSKLIYMEMQYIIGYIIIGICVVVGIFYNPRKNRGGSASENKE